MYFNLKAPLLEIRIPKIILKVVPRRTDFINWLLRQIYPSKG